MWKRNIILFYDTRLRTEEGACYLRRVESVADGYTMAGFRNKQLTFGTMSMIYNLQDNESEESSPISAQEIYEKYKSRTEVETVFDAYKNLLQAGRSYMQTDASFEVWMFINHLTTKFYYKLMHIIKTKGKLEDLLMRLSRVCKLRIGQEWFRTEVPLSSKKIFEALGVTVT